MIPYSPLTFAALLSLMMFLQNTNIMTASAFQISIPSNTPYRPCGSFIAKSIPSSQLYSFSVKASELEEGLTDEEKTIIRVFRQCGPSVAFVTSFLTTPNTSNNRSNRNNRDNNNNRKGENNRPPNTGRSLGSGSGFIVDKDGYLVTNYHVIQRAYELNESLQRTRNITTATVDMLTPSVVKPFVDSFINNTVTGSIINSEDAAKVYVRINSSTKYQLVDVVGARPDLDIAVLKIRPNNANSASPSEETTTDALDVIKIGSSSKLLVGQRVVAIGNPFGLDQTVTAGVVSSLNRDITGVAGNKITNCVQTDASINPGNSGGPLLNSQGKLVGVNTMIISTSGSNAGIGFAVPSDSVEKAALQIIENHRRKDGSIASKGSKTNKRGYIGFTLASDEVTMELLKKKEKNGVLVLDVKENSPAKEGGLIATSFSKKTGVLIGDVIVAINGKEITSGLKEVEEDLRKCVQGEQINLTVEKSDGTRKVVYLTLS